MVKKLNLALIFFIYLVVNNSTFGQDEKEQPYDASVALGYVGTSGNTDVTTVNTEFLLTYFDEKWTHNFEYSSLASSENNAGRAERYFIGNKSDYALMDEDKYLYVQASYTDDRFSGFAYQAIVSAGYGQYIVEGNGKELQGFLGIGYRENDSKITGSEGETVLTLGEEYDWMISETSALTQSIAFDIGDKRTITTFEIGLESNIIDRISTKIAFQYRNNSDVPLGIDKNDTQTSISLVYTF